MVQAKLMKRKNRVTQEQLLKIIDLSHQETLSRRQIATQVGLNPSTVWKYQKLFGFL